MACDIFKEHKIHMEKELEFRQDLGEKAVKIFMLSLVVLFFLCTMAMTQMLSFHWAITVGLSIFYGIVSSLMLSLLFIAAMVTYAGEKEFSTMMESKEVEEYKKKHGL